MKDSNDKKQINQKQVIKNITITTILILAFHYLLTHVLNPNLKTYSFLDRDWGFDNITYLAKWTNWSAYLIIFLVAIYPVSNYLNITISKLGEKVQLKKIFQYPLVKILLFVLIAVGSVFLFKSLQIKYDFLGDMKIRMNQTISGEYKTNSYLTMYLLNHYFVWLSSKIEVSKEVFFSWQSFICGGVYVFFVLLISDLIGKGIFQKVTLFLTSLFIGSILFFFGYREIYAMPYALAAIAVYFNLLYAKGKFPFLLVLIITIILPLFHIILAGIIPSTFIIFFQRNKNKFPKWIKNIKTSYFLFLVFFGFIALYVFAKPLGISFSLMPLKAPSKYPDFIYLFDLRHLWQYINAITLATGIGFITFLILSIVAVKSKIKFDTVLWYLGSASFFMLLITFVSNPIRGSGDWDVFALPALFINLSVVYFLFLLFKNLPKLYQYIICIILVINFFSSASWVLVNHTDKSIDKIADMLIKDPANYYQKGQPAIQQLAFGLEENGLDSVALKYFEINYKQNYTDQRAHFNYAVRLIKNNRKEEGVEILEKLTMLAPHYGMSYPILINVYNNDKNFKKLYETVDKLYNAYLKYPNPILQKVGKQQLVSYFDYLRKVETNLGHPQKVNEISKVMNNLK